MSAGKDVFGDRKAAGPPQPFFHSRWVSAPVHVRDLGMQAVLSRAGTEGHPDLRG